MPDIKSIGGTVRARAAGELRDRILTGRLRAGSRIDLDEITREFGTSRTPVREALLELSYEGLVSVTPRSGITVVGITPGGRRRQFRRAGHAGRQGRRMGHRPDHAVGTGRAARTWPTPSYHADDVVAANWRFHRALNLASGSPAPADLPAPGRPGGAGQLLRAVPRTGPPQPGRARRFCSTPSAVAMPSAARVLAEAHVLDAGAALGDWLRTRLPDGELAPAGA